MASSGKDPDEGEVASSATAATDEVDSGWGSEAPPVQASKTADEPEVAKESPPVESPPVESPPVESPSVEGTPVETSPVESPPVESSPAESPPAESPPVESPPVEMARVDRPPVETARVLETARFGSPPVEAARVDRPPVETARVLETARFGSPPAEPPAVESPPAATPSVDVQFDEPTLLASFWGARPNTAWLAVGGGAIVLAFVVGILTGRGSRSEPEDASIATTSALAPPSVAAPAPAPAPGPAPSAPEPEEAPSASSSASPAAPKHVGAGFNAKAAKTAIDKIVPGLKTCKQAGEPPGSATVTVTFAPTGRVSDARVTTTRYAGTRTGTCITQRLRQARIPEFVGSPVTVKRSVAIR
jgi:hypothetical protein